MIQPGPRRPSPVADVIATVLREQARPMTVQELAIELAGYCAPATVERALRGLEEAARVRRSGDDGWVALSTAILERLRAEDEYPDGPMSVSELAEALGLLPFQLESDLRDLELRGLIRQSTRASRWEVA